MIHSERPVQPKDLNNHGLLGLTLQKQHMMIDNQWTAAHLSDQFKSMRNCLAKHQQIKRIETAYNDRAIAHNYHKLRKECRNGRKLLHGIRFTENRHVIRNLLMDNKEKQCLYQHMPAQQVLENIDQRTFGLRKEYDRLNDRKVKLEKKLQELRLNSAALEDRMKFPNNELEEEKRAKNCQKQLANSKMRLKAIETINMSYKKILQILKHDEIFYEPILQSLYDDINDQKMFIEHILDLGKPALQKFHKLKEHFEIYDDKVHKDIQTLLHGVASKNKLLAKKPNQASRFKEDEGRFVTQAREHYMHTTKSMSELETELHRVSEVIKNIKFATLCSSSREIFPRIKGQIDNNYKLKKEIVCDSLCYATMETKEKFSEVLQEVIKNNLSQAEIDRLDRITNLKELISIEDKMEMENIVSLKQNNDVFVLLRVFLWNIYDMLHHVYKTPRLPKINYPNSYLKLPLLKFEMMTMYTCPPDPMDEDVKHLYSIIHRKLTYLIAAFNTLTSNTRNQSKSNHNLRSHRDAYIDEFITRIREHEAASYDVDQHKPVIDMVGDGDRDYESKNYGGPSSSVKTREQMKSRSIYLVEERLKSA